MNTFEDFLRDCMDNGHTQIKLVPRYSVEGDQVSFYAVGQCGIGSSETFDGSVGGNVIGGPEEVAELTPTVSIPSVFVDPEVETVIDPKVLDAEDETASE